MTSIGRDAVPGSTRRAVLFGGAGMVCVGTSVSVSTALVHAPLFLTQSIRYVLGALLLLTVARLNGQRVHRPHGREWLWLAGVATSGLVVFNVAVVRGVAHAEPAVIAVAVACVPVLLGVAGPIFEGRRPERVAIAAAVVVTAGSVLVVGTGRTDRAGMVWAALALACEAGFTLLALPVLGRLGAMSVSVHTVWIAALMLAALGLVTERPASVAALGLTQWLAVLHLAVVVTALAFVLWFSAVRSLGAGTAGLLTGIAPISAAVTGIAVGVPVPGPSVWVGIAVVLIGLSLGLAASGRDGARGPTPDGAEADGAGSDGGRTPDGAAADDDGAGHREPGPILTAG